MPRKNTAQDFHKNQLTKVSSSKVFISYVQENKREVDSICGKFTEKGIEYWIDRNDIEPGKDWKLAIKNAIGNGCNFLACFSKESVQKEQTHMNEELLQAIEILRKKRCDSGWLIPIRLSKCDIPQYEITANKSLSNLHILDIYEDFEKGLDRLVDYILRQGYSTTSNPGVDEMVLEYQSLKALIDAGNGDYFHNADMGHPVYVMGAAGKTEAPWNYGDSPTRNILFKKLAKISKELKKRRVVPGYTWWYDFSTWKDFCKYVVNAYRKQRGRKGIL